jgi:hypothetical protein
VVGREEIGEKVLVGLVDGLVDIHI